VPPGFATTAAASGFAHFRRHWRFYAAHVAAFSLLCLICAAHVAWGATYLIRHYHWSVGEVGTVLGRHGVNIATFALGRENDRAIGVVIVDETAPIADAVLSELRTIPAVREVRLVRV